MLLLRPGDQWMCTVSCLWSIVVHLLVRSQMFHYLVRSKKNDVLWRHLLDANTLITDSADRCVASGSCCFNIDPEKTSSIMPEDERSRSEDAA